MSKVYPPIPGPPEPPPRPDAVDRMKLFGKALYRGWMAFALKLGAINAGIILTVVYVVLIGPIRLIQFLLRKDDLQRRRPWPLPPGESYFHPVDPADSAPDRSQRQF